MKYKVIVTDGALADIAEIDDFISVHHSIENARHVIDMLEDTIRGLSELPDRGHYPCELSSLGIKDYREVEWTSYRIIYRVADRTVYVYVVVAARRDLRELLQRRLLSM